MKSYVQQTGTRFTTILRSERNVADVYHVSQKQCPLLKLLNSWKLEPITVIFDALNPETSSF